MKQSILLLFALCISHFAFSQQYGRNSRSEHQANASFLLTGWLITYWNGTAWENAWNYLYTYDGGKNRASSIEQDWADTAWINQFNYTYSYDDENRLIEEINRDWSDNQWFNDNKNTFSYDSHGNILTEAKYTWLSSSTDWLLILQKDYSYDGSDNMISWKIKTYSGGALVDKFKMVFFYDLSNNMIESVLSVSNNGTSWEIKDRFLGVYDQNNNLIESTSQYWDGYAWADEFKMTYLYDTNNRQTQETIQYMDSTAWVNVNQYKYSYDPSGNKTEQIKQNGSGAEWVNYERYTYEFSGSNKLLVTTYYLWNGVSWAYFNIEQNSYDINANLTQTLFRDWGSGNWADKRLDHFTYISSNSMAEEQAVGFMIFPNPTESKCKVQNAKCKNSDCTVHLVDLFGRKVMDVFEGVSYSGVILFDVSHLPAGVYFCRISADGFTQVEKIIKK